MVGNVIESQFFKVPGGFDTAAALSFTLMALILALVFLRWVVLRWKGERLTWEPPAWVPIAIGVGVVVYGVARNLPGLGFLSPA